MEPQKRKAHNKNEARSLIIAEMYARGDTFAEIARRLGISRQCVQQNAKRDGVVSRGHYTMSKRRKREAAIRPPAVVRFWSKVKISPDMEKCWEWQDATGENFPYGLFWFNGRQHPAHRMAYFFANGQMPKDWALHKCGNHKCVNPNHLYNGTPKQNADDRAKHAIESGKESWYPKETWMSPARRKGVQVEA